MKKVFVFISVSVFVLLMAGAIALAGYYFFDLRRVRLLADHYPTIQYERNSKFPTIKMSKKRPANWVSLSNISNDAVGAIVVSEDWAFFQHMGFDLEQIRESIEVNMREQRYVRGASTITQQVVRNVFLDKDKNLYRKVKELVMSVMLERYANKQRILEVYLNIAEWGDSVYGIGPAARLYFKKTPAALTAKEGAFLAMLLPSPQRYAASYRRREMTPFANKSVERILTKMVQAGFITKDHARDEACSRLGFENASSDAVNYKGSLCRNQESNDLTPTTDETVE